MLKWGAPIVAGKVRQALLPASSAKEFSSGSVRIFVIFASKIVSSSCLMKSQKKLKNTSMQANCAARSCPGSPRLGFGCVAKGSA